MRLLAACSLGGAGHFNPLVPFLTAAHLSGNEVLVIGPQAIEQMVRDAGFPFHAGGEPDGSDVAVIREQLIRASRDEATILGNRDLFGQLATTAMLPEMENLCAQWHPTFVLREPCEYASAIVAGATGIPTAQVAISSAAGEFGSIAAAAPVLERYRPGLVQELKASPYLTRFPSSMDPDLFSSTLRYKESPARPAQPLPDWWNGSRYPLIYVTFGSVLGHMTIANRVFEMFIDALSRVKEVRVLMTVGRGFDISSIGPLPTNMHVEPWVEQADALSVANLAVCHGGSGTVLGALAAGVPLVVVPFFADQFNNATQVARTGAGTMVEIPREDGEPLGPDDLESAAVHIAHAINLVVEDSSYRAVSASISKELTERMTPAEALTDLTGGLVATER